MVKGKKAATRKAIRDTMKKYLGEVKIQLPKRGKEKVLADFGGAEMAALNERADEWLSRNGHKTAVDDREPVEVLTRAPNRARVVHTIRHDDTKEKRGRRVSVVVSHETKKVLGEQG